MRDKFSTSVPEHQDKDARYKFVNETFKGRKYCKEITKKHLKKELVISKKMKDVLEKLKNIMCDLNCILKNTLY